MVANSSSLSTLAPPVFDEENYQAWAMKMQVYLEGCDYWEAVEDDYEVAALPDYPTLNQIRHHKEMKTKKAKAKACLYVAVSPAIFSIIMACDSAKKIWDFLKAEYQGDEKIKIMKGLNLVRKFEGLQIKESGTIKEYSTKLVDIANKARLLGTDLSDNRLVQKILVSLPKRYEATIASLENTKNLSQIKLAELVCALQAPEQRSIRIRLKESVEEALRAKVQQNLEGKEKKWKEKKRSDSNSKVIVGEGSVGKKGGRYSPCKHCGKQNHPHFRCWRRPDVRCRRCQKMGHIEKFCKEKGDQHQGEAHAAIQQEVDQLFVASFISSTPCDSWLVDSGCTNHMTSDEKLFRNLDKSIKSRLRIGNGQHLAVEGRGSRVERL